jgi:hypothetical protein
MISSIAPLSSAWPAPSITGRALFYAALIAAAPAARRSVGLRRIALCRARSFDLGLAHRSIRLFSVNITALKQPQ